MKYSFIFLICLAIVFLSGCVDYEPVKAVGAVINKEQISIYRLATGNYYVLQIDSALFHKDTSKVLGVPPMGHKIGTLTRQPDKASTIYLKVDKYDTTFQMPLYQYDSVMFGYKYGYGFMVETSFNANDWGKD